MVWMSQVSIIDIYTHKLGFLWQVFKLFTIANCKFETAVILNTVEREQVADTKLVFDHDWTQLLYCLNVYCILYNNTLSLN